MALTKQDKNDIKKIFLDAFELFTVAIQKRRVVYIENVPTKHSRNAPRRVPTDIDKF